MSTLQTLPILQSGLKFFFDIDPCLTEHLFRSTANQASILGQSAAMAARGCGERFADMVAPLVHDLRSIRLGNLEL